MLMARKWDSRYVRSGRAPGGGEVRASARVGGVERWWTRNLWPWGRTRVSFSSNAALHCCFALGEPGNAAAAEEEEEAIIM